MLYPVSSLRIQLKCGTQINLGSKKKVLSLYGSEQLLQCNRMVHHVSGSAELPCHAVQTPFPQFFQRLFLRLLHAIFEVQVPEAWIGKSVGELNVRRKFGINILGIKRAGKTDVFVTPDTILSDDTTILALGEYKALQKCFRI